MSHDIRNHIREFDHDYKLDPERAGKQRRPGVDSLRDGTYTFTIVGAEADVVTDNKTPIVRLVLKVEDAGCAGDVIEHVYWLNNQVQVNILGQDLATLGIDSPQWTGQRKFSDELHQVLVSRQLVGRRFKGKKVADLVKGKTYHRLYINWGLGQYAGFPEEPQPAAQSPALLPDDDDEIPW